MYMQKSEIMAISKFIKGVTAIALAGASMALVACGGGNSTVKVGVLVADASGDEAIGFKNYLQQYVAKEYNYEFVYSPQLDSAEQARAQAETFIGQNCKAIIDMADKNRGDLAQLCNTNKVYFAIGSGMMSDEDYNASKNLEYFVGQIGPDMVTEYNTGLAMGQYYKETKKVSKVGVYGAFIPNPMHLYRMAGLLTGLGDTYKGQSGQNIVYTVFGDGAQFDASNIAGDVTIDYCSGFDGEGAIFGRVGEIIAGNPDAFLSVGMTTTFFADMLDKANLEYSDIDSFTTANGAHMKTGSLKYLAGKYSSSLGPIFAAIKSAIDGKAIRLANGDAFSLSQGYWTAKSSAEFEKFQSADSVTNPIFNKTVLDTLIGASYDSFKAAVELDRTPQ